MTSESPENSKEASRENLKLEKLNYSSYLKVDKLLSLQNLLSNPPHHDEMFFIIIHQAAELWFKEILHETEALITALETADISRGLKVIRRLSAIMELQVKQINLLATLTPVEFAGFRDQLRPASGFQSVQFRLIEYAYGLRDEFFLKFFETDAEAIALLKGWKNSPSVADVFKLCMEKNAPPVKRTDRAIEVQEGLDTKFLLQLREIYENSGKNDYWVLLCEALLDFDEKFSQWRSTHILMVGRTIGMKKGTGGSAGYKFLQSRMEARFFPELWAIRTQVGLDY